jgi:integrase
MRRIAFTDIALRALKPTAAYTTWWDSALPSFGIRVGLHSKTFVVVRGKSRKRIALGKFPSTPLKEARSKALSIIDGAFTISAAQDTQARIDEYVRQLDASQRHKYEQERLLKRHLLPYASDLTALAKKDILKITDSLSDSPSSQLHCHRALKAFFNWCVQRDYVTTHPMQGLPLPNRQKTRDRLLTPKEIKTIWSSAKKVPRFGIVIRACILLGTREGETSAIRAEWLLPDMLVIPATNTKNREEHVLPLSSYSRKLLYEIASSPRANWNSWNKIKKTIDVQNWTVHDTRRFFSTTLAL